MTDNQLKALGKQTVADLRRDEALLLSRKTPLKGEKRGNHYVVKEQLEGIEMEILIPAKRVREVSE